MAAPKRKGKCGVHGVTDFYKSNGTCVTCSRGHHKAWKVQNPDKLRAEKLAYADRNPEKVAWARRVHWMRVKYGLSEAQFLAMFAAQEGKCGCCGIPVTLAKIQVDHCHAAGHVRALLCHNCNSLLGHAKGRPRPPGGRHSLLPSFQPHHSIFQNLKCPN